LGIFGNYEVFGVGIIHFFVVFGCFWVGFKAYFAVVWRFAGFYLLRGNLRVFGFLFCGIFAFVGDFGVFCGFSRFWVLVVNLVCFG